MYSGMIAKSIIDKSITEEELQSSILYYSKFWLSYDGYTPNMQLN